ncbi:MAG: SRPBCC family protein [Streptomycetaceae bacterium]|nr:SRPBCC family protein [Streptomycetaceae bacterium]
MKLENTLRIPVPADEAWAVLLDIERIAPCVPGATLTGQDADGYHGKMKVKIGAIGLTYNGTVKFLSQDQDAKVAVLEASGREMRGNGTAKALVTCRLVEAGAATEVFVETELGITGKPAQFGRGALAEVSGALIGRFAANLAEELTASAAVSVAETKPAEGAEAAPATAPADADADAEPAVPPTASVPAPGAGAEPLDLIEAAGFGAVKRFAPYAAAAAGLLLIALALRKPRGRRPVEVVVVDCRGHHHP